MFSGLKRILLSMRQVGWRGYALSAAAVVIATLIRAILTPAVDYRIPFATYLVAVVAIAWYVGLLPAMVTLLASTLTSLYFFIPPANAFVPLTTADGLNCGFFILFGGFCAYITDRIHAIKRRAEENEEQARESLRRLEAEMHRRELAQKEIVAQRAWLEMVAETVPDILFSCGADGTVEYVNQRFYDYTGMEAGTALGRGWVAVLHPDDRKRQQETWERALAQRAAWEIDMRLRAADGSYRWFLSRVRPMLDDGGAVTNWLGATTDIHDFKETERAMRESQHFAEQIAYAMPDIVYVYSFAEDRHLYINRAIKDLFGYEVETVLNSSISFVSERVHPDDLDIFEASVQRLHTAKDGEVVEAEYRVQDVNGAWRWLFSRDTVLSRNPDGSIREALGVEQDVTDRKWAEEQFGYLMEAQEGAARKMQEAHALLDAFFASATVGLAFFDTEIRYQRINRWLANINGLPVEAHIGHTPSELLPYLDEEFAVRLFRQIMETRQPVEFEASVPMPDASGQTSHWIASYYPVLLNDELLGVGAVTIDITERKQAEERTRLLQKVTAAFSKALTPEEVAEAFVRIVPPALGGHRGVFGLLNTDAAALELIVPSAVKTPLMERYQRMSLNSGFPITEAVRLNQIVILENLDAFRQYPNLSSELLAESGTQANITLPLNVADHILGAISISFPQPMPDLAQEQDFYVSLAQQCAQAMERALLYRTEAAARTAAEEANQIKIKFLGMITHELRTPLTSIKGFAGSLLAPDAQWDAAKQREFLMIIDEESDKLADLVEQLLDVSRLQAGTLRIAPGLHRLEKIITVAMPQMEALTRRHVLELHLDDPMPPVWADYQRIAQVLVNLVGNAAKYSPAGTTIRLNVQRQNEFVCIEVVDEGEGIPPEKRAAVFEPFHQLEKRARQRGAGLGLAICKGLVEAHGGRIWIEDRPAPGTTIRFTLPVAGETTVR